MGRFFRNRLVKLLLLGSIVGISFLIIPFQNERPLLLEKARPIARIDPQYAMERSFDWAPNGDLVIFRPTGGPDRYKLSRISATTGVEADIAGFNRRMRGVWGGEAFHSFYFLGPSNSYLPPEFQLSPNGESMIWRNQNFTGFLARLDGSQVSNWESAPGFDCPRWLASGHGWVQPYNWTGLKLTFSSWAHTGAGIHTHPGGRLQKTVELKGMPLSGQFEVTATQQLVQLGPQTQPDTVVLFNADLTVGPTSIRKRSVKLPNPSQVSSASISRCGNLLACTLRVRIDPPGPPLMQRALRKLGMHAYEEIGLWTHDLRTAKWQLIGRIAERPKRLAPAVTDIEFPVWTKWLPDGRTLSFVYRSQIWLVPAI